MIIKTNSEKLIKILGRDLTTRFKRGIQEKVGISYRDFEKFSIFKKYKESQPIKQSLDYQSAGSIKKTVISYLLKRHIIKFIS